jgi:hypothetical protein
MRELRFVRYAIVLSFVLALPESARADDVQLAEIRNAWSACQDEMVKAPDDWIGWRRSFFNGYGDDFAFWDNRNASPPKVSILRTVQLIDAIAAETRVFCFRGDGTLAFIQTTMVSPNIVGGKQGEIVRREGSIYVSSKGDMLDISGQIVDPEQNSHLLGNTDWQPARPCAPIALYLNVDDVERAYQAEMGDIEGKRPAFVPQTLDWCSRAENQ